MQLLDTVIEYVDCTHCDNCYELVGANHSCDFADRDDERELTCSICSKSLDSWIEPYAYTPRGDAVCMNDGRWVAQFHHAVG